MSVHVTLLPAALPEGYENAERTESHEDRATGEIQLKHRYSLQGSGALVVWKCQTGTRPEIDVVYGPSAWERVQGDLLEDAPLT